MKKAALQEMVSTRRPPITGPRIVVDRPITLQVVGQQDVRRPACQFNHCDAGSHAFDGKAQPPTQHLDEEAHIRSDVLAGGVDVVELVKRSQVRVVTPVVRLVELVHPE